MILYLFYFVNLQYGPVWNIDDVMKNVHDMNNVTVTSQTASLTLIKDQHNGEES